MKRLNLVRMAVPIGVVGIVLLLVLPIPAAVLDVLFVINIMLALVILLTTMFVKKPLDFSVFPSLLLVATLFRLGLNVASTRLVLGDGNAGALIAAFGHVAVDGSVVIGAVVFAILVVIQFVVITKGAERVAEVGARFTLDAMPGKQMAIDAELNAGLITEQEAKRRRIEVAAEADFYGAMDGGSKFVKGDAIAGIIIILINIVGGIAVGMLQKGMDIGTAVNSYTLLTIGDGLVSQIPALLLAVSTGMIVTRANSEEDMGQTASRQLGQSRMALMIAGCAAIVVGLVPGMPILAFAIVGVGLIFVSQKIKAKEVREQKAVELAEQVEAEQANSQPATESTDELIEQMRVHAIEINLAPDIVDLVGGASDDLVARIRALRGRVARELGFVVPAVRTRDAVNLPSSAYSIRIAGVETGLGIAPRGKLLALGGAAGALDSLPGEELVDPVFGLPGKWIPAELRRAAEVSGATVIDRLSVVTTHLHDVIVKNAARLLSREDVRVLTDAVRRTSPAAVDELTPNPLSLADVQRVLQGLLAERVPINDLARIFESVGLKAKTTTDPEALVEAARLALGPAIAEPYTDRGVLRVVCLEPQLEQALLEGLRPSEFGSHLVIDGPRFDALLDDIRQKLTAAEEAGRRAVVVCAPQIRAALRRLVVTQVPDTAVLAYQEVERGSGTIETVGVIRADAAHAAV